MAIAPGTTIGRYRVLREVGRGDFVAVYRALDMVQRCAVTMKVLEGSPGPDDAVAQRFQQEAEAALRLGSHPHLLTVHTAGRIEGNLFIVMEFLPGVTLEQSLSGPLELALTAKIVAAVAAALDAAHSVGLVHRDVKPANILLGRGGRIVLTDFGIAGLVSAARRPTQAIRVLGTPEYLAPELVNGGLPSPQSDQYALAVVAYELLTGSRPFPEREPLAVLYAHAHVPPPPPTTLRSELPPEVDAVLLRALAKEPTARFRDCTALATALREALGLADVAAPAEAGAGPPAPDDTPLVTLVEKARELVQAGEGPAALRAVQAARAVMPDDERLQQLAAEIEAEVRLAERYDRALRHLRAHDWLAAREILNALYAERPDYRDVAALRAQAFAAIRQAWEKEERLRGGRDPFAAAEGDNGRGDAGGSAANGAPGASGPARRTRPRSAQERLDEELSWRYDAAVTAIGDGNWRTALLILEGISERAPQYRDVPMLLRRVRIALARQERGAFDGDWPAKLTYRPARFLRRVFSELLQQSRRRFRRHRDLEADLLAELGAAGAAASATAPPSRGAASAPNDDRSAEVAREPALASPGAAAASAAAELRDQHAVAGVGEVPPPTADQAGAGSEALCPEGQQHDQAMASGG